MAYRPCAPGPTDRVGQSWHVCMHICIFLRRRRQAWREGRDAALVWRWSMAMAMKATMLKAARPVRMCVRVPT